MDLKILFIIGSLEIGGTEKQLLCLAGLINDSHHDCCIFSLQRRGSLREKLVRKNIRVYDGGLKKGDLKRSPWKLIGSILKLIKIISKERPTVVHAFLPLATFIGALCGRMTGVPLVITGRRAMGFHQERYPFLKVLDRMANRLSHRVTVNSRAVWDDVVMRDGIASTKLVLIYNSIDTKLFDSAIHKKEMIRLSLGIKSYEKVIIVVANFIPYKGHRDFIDAAHEVTFRFNDIKILLIGEDRGIRCDLEKQISHVGLSNKIIFLGRRNDIPEMMAAADLSVLPSHEEGFSNVILESMAAGLPVVATDVGGNREAIISGVTGWLVPPRNHSALAKKMTDLLSDPKKAARWGEKGRAIVKKKYNTARMADDYLKLYLEGSCAA